jgi:hypothetical protein
VTAAAVNGRGWALALATPLLVASMLASFAVSSMALAAIGVQYDSPDGPMWQKLHPATYLAVLAMLFRVLGQSRPLAYVTGLARAFPGAAFFVAMWTSIVAYAALVQKSPLTLLIEPYPVALAALFAHDDLAPATRAFVRKALHAILVANVLIGIFEILTQNRLFPFVIAGQLVEDGRSTALLGHPLLNASTTGAYLLCLFLGGDPRLRLVPRAIIVSLSLLGLLAFGGRTALVATCLIVGCVVLWKFVLFLFGGRVDLRRVAAVLAFSPVFVIGVAGAAATGMFDTTLARFIDDNGSAQARLIALQLLDTFDMGDLLFGPRPDVLTSTLNTLGISVGIESTWLGLAFSYGALITGFFVVGLFVLFWEYWRRARSGAVLLFVYFIVVISAANGLATKTLTFVQFSILLLYFFQRQPGVSEREPDALAQSTCVGPEPGENVAHGVGHHPHMVFETIDRSISPLGSERPVC